VAIITNYATLQTAIADWLNRTDLTSVIPNFVQNAEARFKRDPRVRDPDTAAQAVATITFTGNVTADDSWQIGNQAYVFKAVPSVANEVDVGVDLATSIANLVKAVNATGTAGTEYAAGTLPVPGVTATGSATVLTLTVDTAGDTGLSYHISEVVDAGGVATVAPFASGTGATSVIPLSASVTTNWLVTNYPDIYLFGSLVEAAPYLKDDGRVVVWESELQKRLDELSGSVRVDPVRALGLTTYAELKRVVADWLDRGDLENVVPVLITLAEARLQRDRRVRNLATATYSITADDIAVPTTFGVLESWYHDGPNYYGPIETVGAEQLGTLKARFTPTGAPRYAAIVAGKFRFAPGPDSTYTTKMVFWETLSALSAGANWLYTSHPDVYLYASLVEAEPYLGRDPRVLTWKAELEERLEAMHRYTWDVQFSGSMTRQYTAIG
jgi:hypothetical protein